MPRVLVVDDEPFVLAVLTKLLALDGYEVLALASPGDALSQLTQESFLAVVCDLEMPGINGLHLLEAARLAQPHTRLVLLTADEREFELPVGVARLTKPLEYSLLLALLPPSG